MRRLGSFGLVGVLIAYAAFVVAVPVLTVWLNRALT